MKTTYTTFTTAPLEYGVVLARDDIEGEVSDKSPLSPSSILASKKNNGIRRVVAGVYSVLLILVALHVVFTPEFDALEGAAPAPFEYSACSLCQDPAVSEAECLQSLDDMVASMGEW